MMKASKASFGAAKSKLLNSLMLAALAVPGVAMAEEASPFSANVGFTTDYIFRGISQTSGNPAVQGGIDFAHASGLYAGIWGSNVSWISDFNAGVSSSLELDTYFGFRNSLADDFGYDVGFIRYNYPASNYPAGATKADTDEIYGALGYKWITAKYSYGLGKFLTVPGAAGTNYIEVNASVPLGDTGITLGAHAGKQTYKGTAADALALAGTSATYSDYKLSIAKDINGYVVSLAASDTNASGFYTTPAGKDLGRSTVVLSVTHAF
ncbi:MAG: TorF family putative porin [Gallionella sp.]|nr:TorF family putative porin [Gallionella sp.]